MRGDSLARQQRLLNLLDQRREICVPDAARELNAHVRTVYRDLQALEKAGAPLYPDRVGGRARWRVVEGWAHKITLSFSFLDLVALSAGCSALDGQPQLQQAARRALQRLRERLPKDLADRAGRAALKVGGSRLPEHPADGLEPLARLTEALERDETVKLVHLKAGAQRASSYTVDPYRLVVQAQGTYLVGWCHERAALRIFALERTKSLSGTGRYFVRRTDIDPDAPLHGALGPWSGRAVEVKLRFSPEAVPFLSPDRIHRTLELQTRSGGGVDATLHVPLSPGLTRWLLGWGSEVRVLSPEKLVARVREEHRKATEGWTKE